MQTSPLLSKLSTIAGSLLVLSSLGWSQTDAPRRRELVDRGWKFYLGDNVSAKDSGFNDATWYDVNLPHSFSIPYFRSPEFYVGYGWYRRHLKIASLAPGRQSFLEFEGVFQEAEIYVNGQQVGLHRGGYTGFSVDVTSALHAGDNVIAVRVNNKWNPQLNPRAGEHVFSGGIYRDVYLVQVEPVHVAWYGTFVTTPEVSRTSAAVRIETELVNAQAKQVLAQVHTTILDPHGRAVAEFSSETNIAAGAHGFNRQTLPKISQPMLWSPDHPSLYKAITLVLVAGQVEDMYATTFGIRSIQWTAEHGFFLNGEHLYFHGADVHQDHAGWGDAVTDAGFARDVQMVKDAGFDFIRGSHYPHDPSFADACDQLGVLFWSENSFWGTGGFAKGNNWTSGAYPTNAEDQGPFEQSVRDSLRDMIRINRNHPSIVVWSMTNEVFFSDKTIWPKMKAFLATLVQYSHQLDPTRPAALGGVQRGGLDKIGDVAGYNGDGARLFIDPGVANAVSEYGSAVEQRPGAYDPHWHDLQQTEFAWRSGQVLWCAFDHGSIAGKEGMMGMIDYFRIPKRAWFWYRDAYRKIPPPVWPVAGDAVALKLATNGGRTIQHADGTGDVQILVAVVGAKGETLSNAPPVTLTIESGPGEFPTGRSIAFMHDSDIDIREGLAAIEFRSYYSGNTVIRATSPGLRPDTITIASAGAPPYVSGQTPIFQPPPYVRFTNATQRIAALEDLSRDRPTRASSEAAGHTARFANDGAGETYWAAAEAGDDAWWEVELERDCDLKQVTFSVPFSGTVSYSIQVSNDMQRWTTVLRNSETLSPGRSRTLALPPGTSGGFVRVVFDHLPDGVVPALSEFTVEGDVRKG